MNSKVLSRRAELGLKKLQRIAKTREGGLIPLKEARTILGRNASLILKELVEKGFIRGIKTSSDAVSYSYFLINEYKKEVKNDEG